MDTRLDLVGTGLRVIPSHRSSARLPEIHRAAHGAIQRPQRRQPAAHSAPQARVSAVAADLPPLRRTVRFLRARRAARCRPHRAAPVHLHPDDQRVPAARPYQQQQLPRGLAVLLPAQPRHRDLRRLRQQHDGHRLVRLQRCDEDGRRVLREVVVSVQALAAIRGRDRKSGSSRKPPATPASIPDPLALFRMSSSETAQLTSPSSRAASRATSLPSSTTRSATFCTRSRVSSTLSRTRSTRSSR